MHYYYFFGLDSHVEVRISMNHLKVTLTLGRVVFPHAEVTMSPKVEHFLTNFHQNPLKNPSMKRFPLSMTFKTTKDFQRYSLK